MKIKSMIRYCITGFYHSQEVDILYVSLLSSVLTYCFMSNYQYANML